MPNKVNITNNSSGKYLYKYLPFNQYSLQILIDEQLWLGSPDLLNDPFEGDFIINNYKDLRTKEIIDLVIKIGGYNDTEYPKMFYQYSFDSMVKDDIEFLNTLYDFTSKSIKNTFGSTSFSQKCESLLMWSHYADSHKGFVLVFDREKLQLKITDDITKLIDVKYGSLPTINLICKENNISIHEDKDLLISKLKDWVYEQEVRIIKKSTFRNDYQRLLNYDFDCISGIIYGQRMLVQNALTIRKIINEKEKDILFYRAKKSLKRDKIEFIEIPFNRTNN